MKYPAFILNTLEEFKVEEFTVNQKTVLKSALAHYGKEKQLVKCLEECGELVQILAKIVFDGLDKSAKHKADLAGEIADVEILLAQVKHTMNIGPLVDITKGFKITRLKNRIRNAQTGQIPTITEHESINS